MKTQPFLIELNSKVDSRSDKAAKVIAINESSALEIAKKNVPTSKFSIGRILTLKGTLQTTSQERALRNKLRTICAYQWEV